MENYPAKKLRTSFLILTSISLTAASGLVAQTTSPATAPAEDSVALEKFEVTGTYLPTSSIVGSSPIDIITSQQIVATGSTDVLQLLKRMNPAFQGKTNIGTESNNSANTGGGSYVALRNLQTLVLLNNRRVVTSADTSASKNSPGPQVDLNTIPLAMIDHIDVFKDGASTIYGSDAIGGVVNIVLKKDYNGFELDSNYGYSTHGKDYTTRSFSVVGGVAKDGSSITVGVQYYRNDQLASNKRDISSLSIPSLVALGRATAPSYYSGSFVGAVGNDILAGSPLAIGAPGYKATITSPPVRTDPNSAGQTLTQLEAAGYYIPISTTPLSQSLGGKTTILNTTQFGTASIIPSDRRQLVLNSEHELFGKRLVVFTDVLVSNNISDGSSLAPSPLSGVGSSNLSIPANNPYNPFGVTIGVGQAPGAPTVKNRLEENGNRYQHDDVLTYRIVGGFRGEISDNYHWETAFNYGRSRSNQNTFGGGNGSVLNQLLIPQVVGGNYVYDANGKPLSAYSDSQGPVPVYNYFGLPGSNNARAIKAISTTLFQTNAADLRSIDARFIGTPVELPAGKIAFAIGGEYREETVTSAVDGLYAQGLALGFNAANTFPGGKRQIKSIFAEVNVPITGSKMNVPGAYALEMNFSGRHEDLGTPGKSNVPKIGLKWQPLGKELTIRGTYAKSFFAPAISSLYGPASQNSPTLTVLEGNGSGSSGGSTGRLVTGQFIGNDSELSNPNLPPQHSKSYTAGIVYSPKQLRGLTLNVDYYHIWEDGVGGIDYSSAFADLNAKGSGSIYASKFKFQDGTTLTSTTPNQVTSTNIGNFAIASNPSGELVTSGLDVGIVYDLPSFNELGKLSVGATANILFTYKQVAVRGGHWYEYGRQYTSPTYGLGIDQGVLPGYEVKPYLVYAWKNLTVTLDASYIPSVKDNGSLFGNYQNLTSPKNAAGQYVNTSTYFSPTSIGGERGGQAYNVKSFTTFDFAVSYEFGKGRKIASWYEGFGATVGINNLTNSKSPFIPDAQEDNTSKQTYDILGRFAFVALSKKF